MLVGKTFTYLPTMLVGKNGKNETGKNPRFRLPVIPFVIML